MVGINLGKVLLCAVLAITLAPAEAFKTADSVAASVPSKGSHPDVISLAQASGPQDVVSERRSYGDRISDAMAGFVAGIILVIFSFGLLWFIEDQAIIFSKLLGRAESACAPNVDCSKVSKKFEGRLVHMKGDMKVDSPAVDSVTGFEPKQRAIKIRRTAEMYQWEEKEVKRKESTDYEYHLKWLSTDQSSAGFRHSSGHENPPRRPSFQSGQVYANKVSIGAFDMSKDQLDKLHRWHDVGKITDEQRAMINKAANAAGAQGDAQLQDAPAMIRQQTAYQNSTNLMDNVSSQTVEYMFWGRGTLNSPQVGDVRLRYEVVEEGLVSVVGVQTGNTFRSYTREDSERLPGEEKGLLGGEGERFDSSPGCCGMICGMLAKMGVGNDVLLVDESECSKMKMFWSESIKFKKRVWLMRLVGFLCMWVGLTLIFNPIPELLSFLPYVDTMLKSIIAFAMFVVALVLTSFTIALSWSVHRPYIMGAFLTLIGVACWLHVPRFTISAYVSWGCAGGSVLLTIYNVFKEWQFRRAVKDQLARDVDDTMA